MLPLLAVLAALTAVDPPPSVRLNDNRHPAGRLESGRLRLSLVASLAAWKPEGADGPAHEVAVFGEEGQPPSNPGPLIRTRTGTPVTITLRNALAQDLTVHGLCGRPGPCPDVLLTAGASRTLRFTLATPGTYTYWAALGATALDDRALVDSELGGVIVVDPPGEVKPDRIFVVSIVSDPAHEDDLSLPFVPTINGASWPNTERLQLRTGETVRIRVANLSFEPHAMHLHGFHFMVDAEGNGIVDRAIPLDERKLEVTERVAPGQTFAMHWTPTRAGNWMFHCHMLAHMLPDPPPTADHRHDAMTAGGGMAGLVLGMTVTGPPTTVGGAPSSEVDRATMTIERDENAFGTHPGYRVAFPDRRAPRVSDTPIPGPILLVERGKTTEVSIQNHTPDPTAIHWHGLELESYYDGVAGFGGEGASITPPIAPGGSFVARFTPPKAGTFIYHTHWHDQDQLSGGLYGPLIVMPPGRRFDPQTDHVVLVGLTHLEGQDEPLMMNGSVKPGPIMLRAGVTNRLRLINITANNVDLTFRLTNRGELADWTPRAQDGATLPPALQRLGPARSLVTVGGTYDVELPAGAAGNRLWLEVRRSSGAWLLQAPLVFSAAAAASPVDR